MENRGSINISKIGFVMSNQSLRNKFINPIFTLSDGTPVYSGDTVEFFEDNNIFPTNGTVQNINGLQLACFNQISNRWRYLEIIK